MQCITAVLVLLCVGMAPVGAHAQGEGNPSASAVAVRGLSFGVIIPGVPETVSVQDVQRRAEVVVSGQGVADVQLLLPREMVSAGGDVLPLVFLPGDAGLSIGPVNRPSPFDPRQRQRIRLPSEGGQLRIYLGGTAQVSPNQPAGTYSATVQVLVMKTDS